MIGRRARAVACVLTGSVLAAAGCSGSGRPPPMGGTLRVAVLGAVQLDTAHAGEPGAVLTASLLYEPLVRVDSRTRAVRPRLAERWTANRAQTRFTFTLRMATFHDGSPVTADDVKATFERVAAKTTASPLAPLLSSVQGYGDVHDIGSTTTLGGVRAAGPRRVEIDLAHPFADFPALLGHPGLGIVARGGADAGEASRIIGSGPFALTSSASNSTMFRRFVTRGAVPSVEHVKLVAVADVAAAQRALGRGDVDVAVLGTDIGEPGRRGQLVDVGSLTVVSYAINLRDPKFADARFREAALRALNAERLVRAAFPGAGKVAASFVPNAVPRSRSEVCAHACASSPGAAAALVREVYPTGNVPIIGLDFPETPPHRALAAEAQVELGEAGIPVTLRPHSPDQYESLVSSGRAEVFVLTIAGTALTPSAFLTPQFVSGNPANVTGLSSSRVDEAVRAADAERKPAAREQDYATAEREVLDQFVLLPIVQLDDRLLVGPRVRGLEVSPLGAIDALTVRVHGSPHGGKKGGR